MDYEAQRRRERDQKAKDAAARAMLAALKNLLDFSPAGDPATDDDDWERTQAAARDAIAAAEAAGI